MNLAKYNADEWACSHTVHDCSTFFSDDVSQAKNGVLLIVYFTRFGNTNTLCLSTWLHLPFSYHVKILQ